MVGESIPEEIKMSDIFKKWCEYCENNVDKNELDFDYEGGYINVSFSVEDVSNDWSSYKTLISLRYLNDFDMLLLQVSQGYENIVLDSDGDSDEIFIEYEE